MRLVDTHTHIYLEEFNGDIQTVLQNAEKQGVEKILMPAIDISTHMDMIELEGNDPGRCMSMMGVHPCSIKADYKKELDDAAAWFRKRKFVAVGEIGLDLYWDKTFFEEQKIAFRLQLDWSLEHDIPVSIHSR